MADIDGSLLLFCEEIKKFSTVALSGEAADEIFGGYPWFHRSDWQNQHCFPWTNSISLRTDILAPEVAESLRLADYIKYRYDEAHREAVENTNEATHLQPAEKLMQQLSYLNITRFMPTLLDRKDRMSMACGLEVRVPFCDHELVEYAFNIPWSMKAINGREKGILRAALQGMLPPEIIERKKSPYPKTHHPAYTKAMREMVLEIMANPREPIHDWLNRQQIQKIVNEYDQHSQLPWFGQLMSGPQFFAYLIQVNFWLKEYKIRVIY
jgi:asparagine synthase (glutamine-hydrolysing)